MSYPCDLRFISSLIFNINHAGSLKQAHLLFVNFFCLLLFLDDNVDEESEKLSNSESSALGC